MDHTNELNVELRCQKCENILREYDLKCKKYLMEGCGHYTCYSCFDDRNMRCPVCGLVSNRTGHKLLSPKVPLRRRGEKKLLIKEEDELEETKQKCSGCQIIDCEQRMYLCETCGNSKFENLEHIKKQAICSDCIIKKHMRKGHETVDFFPYLSALQFSDYSTDISIKSERIRKSHKAVQESILNFDEASKRVTENIDELTDMVRRSKSSKYQIEAVKRMELFINESATINSEIDAELKRKTVAIQNNLIKLEKWYATRTDSCVEDSETIKLPCSSNTIL